MKPHSCQFVLLVTLLVTHLAVIKASKCWCAQEGLALVKHCLSLTGLDKEQTTEIENRLFEKRATIAFRCVLGMSGVVNLDYIINVDLYVSSVEDQYGASPTVLKKLRDVREACIKSYNYTKEGTIDVFGCQATGEHEACDGPPEDCR